VASLVDKNLIRQSSVGGDARFTLLETIRAFAVDQLEAAGEAAEARRRHADYFLDLVETADPLLIGADQVSWLDQLEAEHGNLLAGLSWVRDAHARGAATTAEVPATLAGLRLARGLPARNDDGHLGPGARDLAARGARSAPQVRRSRADPVARGRPCSQDRRAVHDRLMPAEARQSLSLYFSPSQATAVAVDGFAGVPEEAVVGDGRRRWPQKPFGRWLVPATFPRSRPGKGKSVGNVAWLRSRRSRPGVRCGWRSQEPVGTAGLVAAA